nr:MAG TPA: Myc target protein 1 [Caudoviricetes sp.]
MDYQPDDGERFYYVIHIAFLLSFTIDIAYHVNTWMSRRNGELF